MSKSNSVTIELMGDTLGVFLETRDILKDILELEEYPAPELVIAMLFQYGKAPFQNMKDGFGEIRFINNDKNLEKVGHLAAMIYNDWNFFTGQKKEPSTLQ